MIHQPRHAQGVELLIKKLYPLQKRTREGTKGDWGVSSGPQGNHAHPNTSDTPQLPLGDGFPFCFLTEVYSPLLPHFPCPFLLLPRQPSGALVTL